MKRLAAAALSALVACDNRSENKPKTLPSASASAVASAAAVAKSPSAWAGNYSASAADLYVPDGGEYSGFRFRGDDAGDGLGEGALTVSIAPDTGAVSGPIDGPLGPRKPSGFRDGERGKFSLRPSAFDDDAFFGTAIAKIEGAKLTGELRVARARANVIRRAVFSIDPS